MQSRTYDIILWGATGFTGELCAQYMANNYADSVRWAIGGRDEKKLQKVRQNLVQINSKLENLPIVIGNSMDLKSMEEVTAQTFVILATVGPFAKYGTPLVEACVNQRTHYCDITGETIWGREIIDKFHDKAVENGVSLVPFCGFDSVPADLSCLFAIDYINKKLSSQCVNVHCVVEMYSPGLPASFYMNDATITDIKSMKKTNKDLL